MCVLSVMSASVLTNLQVTKLIVTIWALSFSCHFLHFATMGSMHSCTTSWTSASFLFPLCHYWTNL